MNRSVENCPHRTGAWSAPVRYECDLVRQIVGDADPNECAVPTAACQACVRSFPPTARDPNPVVASLAYSAANAAIDRHLVGSQAHERLLEARAFADSNLPRVLPDADDLSAVETPGLATRPLSRDDLAAKLPLSSAQVGQSKGRWVVGMTTAPRRLTTLDESLDGLVGCGFPEPHLFVDGDVDLSANWKHLRRTTRSESAGAWTNFFLGLSELVERDPSADVYLMLQDDLLWPAAPELAKYLKQLRIFLGPRRILSLYTSDNDSADTDGWRCYPDQWKLGALAFAFPRSVARRLTSDPRMRRHGWWGPPQVAGVDFALGQWAKQRGIEIWHPTPSIVQHNGHISAIWATSRVVGLRRADGWLGSPESVAEPESPETR